MRLGLAFALVLTAACNGDEPQVAPTATPLPEGVAMTIGGVPISIDEVDDLADALAVDRRASTRPDLLRRVLVNAVLPRTALGLRNAEARVEALAAAELCVSGLEAGTWANVGVPIEAAPGELDLFLWAAVREASAGDVVGPVEGAVGDFFVAILEEPYDPSGPLEQKVRLTGFSFSYLDQNAPVERMSGQAALDGLEARFASETWRDLLPITVQSRLDMQP